MGQQIGPRKRFIVFRPNSIVSACETTFFLKKFRFGGLFFFAPEFCLRQISATFWLQIGQWEGLSGRIIVFQPNLIVSVSKKAFVTNFRFGARCFFVPKFNFAEIGATFRLEMGQQIRLRKRFILFWPNSIVSPCEMAFFSKFSFRCSIFFSFCARIHFEAN